MDTFHTELRCCLAGHSKKKNPTIMYLIISNPYNDEKRRNVKANKQANQKPPNAKLTERPRKSSSGKQKGT